MASATATTLRTERLESLLLKMKTDNIGPDVTFFNSILTSFANKGALSLMDKYYNMMLGKSTYFHSSY
jgi:hypothetical protein